MVFPLKIILMLCERSLNSGGRYFRNFGGGGCAAGTLEPLAFTRSSEFCYPIQDLTPQIPPPPHHPRVAVLQKLLRSLTQSIQNKTDLIFFIFLSGNYRFP